jgi:hypothetical protein
MASYYALILDSDFGSGSNFVRIIDSDNEMERLRGVQNWNPFGSYGAIQRNRFSFHLVEPHSLENTDTGYTDAASIRKVTSNG